MDFVPPKPGLKPSYTNEIHLNPMGSIVLSFHSRNILAAYLKYHEDDIYHSINDFGDLLQAFTKGSKLLPDAVLVFVGDGNLRGPLENQARCAGISGKVIFPSEDSPAVNM